MTIAGHTFTVTQAAAATTGSSFYDDFNDLSNWTLWGSPRPVRLSSVFGRAGIFDNNGDSSYDSGATSNQTFAPGSGFTIEADVYLQFSDLTGCWAGPAIGLTGQSPAYGSGEYGASLGLWLSAAGDACWGAPASDRRHSYLDAGYRDDTGNWAASPSIRADQYANGWHRLQIDVPSSFIPRFMVDGTVIWSGSRRLAASTTSARSSLWLGNRSSGSAGKAYHDWVRFTPK